MYRLATVAALAGLTTASCGQATNDAEIPPLAESTPTTRATHMPTDADRDAILTTVQALFDALRERDGSILREIVHPAVVMHSVEAGEDGARSISTSERMFDPEVRISGDLAMVWTPYEALIKLDPRLVAETPFATVQSIVASADIAFTNFEAALAPAYLEAGGITFALVASTTSRDERELLLDNVNGVWLGHQADWDRNLEAVREAAANADFVIYYQHLQLDGGDFEGVGPGEQNEDGHYPVADLHAWQEGFAEAIIDAGASLYLGGGHRGFDGVEWYRGRPIVRQFGGLAYHAMRDPGGYPGEFAFWGLIGLLTVAGDQVTGMEFVPLVLNEGAGLFEAGDRTQFLRRRGMSEVATGVMADSILGRFQELSGAFGTPVVVREGRALVRPPAP